MTRYKESMVCKVCGKSGTAIVLVSDELMSDPNLKEIIRKEFDRVKDRPCGFCNPDSNSNWVGEK